MSREAKILVVDDDEQIVEMLVEWLDKRGYYAVGANGGNEGVKAFEQGGYDLVITDLVMSEMDGMELLVTVKSMDPRVVVLMVTGFGTIEMAVLAIKEGAYDFIAKPVDFKSFDVIVVRALEHRRLSRQLSLFRGLTLALIISVPFWLILGIVLGGFGD